MNSAIYLHALTPVHSGTGQVSASVIDLPVAREKATNWPVLPASSLKGVLRAGTAEDRRTELFGTQDKKGSLQIGDARLLCFPARSWKGTFAYVTCPLALRRLARDFRALGIPVPFPFDAVPPALDIEAACVPDGSALAAEGDRLWLDDLDLTATHSDPASKIARGIAGSVFAEKQEQDTFVERFVIVSDEVFDFLAETATEVAARVKLNDDTKTVDKEKGALWYEEAVPAEAIFVAPALGAAVPISSGACIQVGGNETVGRGFCRVMVTPR
jgi:CRISPR-associated protein Cmr4